jgi:hypothetical protein
LISSFSVHPPRLLVLHRRGGRGTRSVLASSGRGRDEVGTRDGVGLKSSDCCERSSRIRAQDGDHPGESWLAGQLRALSCALDESDSRLEPCTRPSTCDNVSKLPAQTGCGSSALGVALAVRNRFDMAPEQAISGEVGDYCLGRSCWPLPGVHSNRSFRKLKDRNGGSNDYHHKGTTGFLPEVRQADRSRSGQVRQVLGNAATAWLAAQELLRRLGRRSGRLSQPEGRCGSLRAPRLASTDLPGRPRSREEPNRLVPRPVGWQLAGGVRALLATRLPGGACQGFLLSGPRRVSSITGLGVPTEGPRESRRRGLTPLTAGGFIGWIRRIHRGWARKHPVAPRSGSHIPWPPRRAELPHHRSSGSTDRGGSREPKARPNPLVTGGPGAALERS